jgi:hypothetical protein
VPRDVDVSDSSASSCCCRWRDLGRDDDCDDDDGEAAAAVGITSVLEAVISSRISSGGYKLMAPAFDRDTWEVFEGTNSKASCRVVSVNLALDGLRGRLTRLAKQRKGVCSHVDAYSTGTLDDETRRSLRSEDGYNKQLNCRKADRFDSGCGGGAKSG